MENDTASDREKAAELMQRTRDGVERIQAVLADAQKAGMVINIGGIGIDQWGRPVPSQISIHKVLA